MWECRVNTDLDSGSDHYPIQTVLNVTPPPPALKATRPQWRKADWPKIKESLKTGLSLLPDTRLTNPGEIDNFADCLTTAMTTVIDNEIPLARHSTKTSPIWSAESSALIRRARAARRTWTASKRTEDYIAFRTIINAKKRQIRRELTKTWRHAVESITEDGSKVWKLAKWAHTRAMEPPALPPFPPLQDEDGIFYHSHNEKARLLASKFFPPPPEVDISDVQAAQYPQEIQILQEVTVENVLGMLRCLPPDKAPGPDGMVNRFLNECEDVVAYPLACLFHACLQLSHYPKAFKRSTTIVLRKPQKDTYTKAKSYRPIALLNTMGKVLERIVAKRMSEAAETHSLLPDVQMGARPGRSTETALELLTEQTRTAWAIDPTAVASVLSLDMAGAFVNASHERLIHNLCMAGLPLWMTMFIASFLKNRTTRLYFDGTQTTPFNTNTGIPQGSPLSPILFLFFASYLLHKLNQGKTTAFGFVDDTNIFAYSRSTEENCRTLEAAHDKCLEWALKHGATFAPEKYNLMHFTRQRKRDDLSAAISAGSTSGPKAQMGTTHKAHT